MTTLRLPPPDPAIVRALVGDKAAEELLRKIAGRECDVDIEADGRVKTITPVNEEPDR